MHRLLTLLSAPVGTTLGPVPSGYAVAFTTDPISDANASATAFQITSAEIGASFNYSISSSGGGTPVTGSGTISIATQNVTGVNVSGLNDGTLTVSLTLTNGNGTGAAATDTVTKLWLPTDISGCRAWYDASDSSTIIHSGGSVSQWDDKSGNGHNATQGTGSLQFTTGTRTVNGRNALDCDGDLMILPSGLFGLSNGANTILIVAAMDGTTGDRLLQGTLAGTTCATVRYANATTYSVQNRTTLSLTATTITRDTNAHVLGFRRSGTDIRGFLDGNLGTAGTNAQDVTVDALRLGDGTDPVDGAYCEVIAFNSSLTNAQLNRAGAALAAKWGFIWTPV